MKTKSTLIKLVISIGFIVLVCFKVQWGGFVAMLGGINMPYFILSLAIIVVMLMTSCLKWQLMLRVQGRRLGFLFLLKNYIIGYFFTVLLPSNVGGDVVRSYYTGKHIGDQYTSAAAVFMERFSGILYLLLLAIVTPFLQPGLLRFWRIIIPMAGSVLLLLLFVAFAANERIIHRCNSLVLRIADLSRRLNGRLKLNFLNKLLDKAMTFYDKVFEKGMKFYRKLRKTTAYFKNKPVYFIAMVALTVLFYTWTWLNILFAFRTFNVDVGMVKVISVLPIIMLVSMLPITLGSIGLAEGAYVFYFALFAVPSESAFIMGLLIRFKLLLTGSIGFVFYLTYKHRREDYEEMVATEIEGKAEE